MKQFSLLLLVALLAGCANSDTFRQRYDHYFPSRSEYVEGVYRHYYDKWLFGAPPSRTGPEPGTEHLWELYHAFHDDASAAHLFFHNPDREASGEHGEAWVYDCVLLLLRLGDDRFSDLLSHEDQKTRELVGSALDSQLDFQRDPFPKTRTLYHSHWEPRLAPRAPAKGSWRLHPFGRTPRLASL